jgi:Mrp family chromosome partitioning ATPase
MSSEVPTNANEGCVGPNSESAGKVDGCAGCPNQSACAAGKNKDVEDPSLEHLYTRMAQIKHKVLVLSGKGGVGKSTFSAQLAFSLASKGFQVGLLDVDICGPSIPRMLGLVGQEVHQSSSGWSPVYVDDNLAVMSIGFMLPSSDDAVIWRGPKKNALIKQFLTDVVWNELDYLIIDTPPGTSDEHISIVQYLKAANVDGAVVVTTPQEVSMADVRKELNFCKKTGLNVLGVVENMANIHISLNDSSDTSIKFVNSNGIDETEMVRKKLRETFPEIFDYSLESPLFTTSAFTAQSNPRLMAQSFGVPYLGSIPMDQNLTKSCENGESFTELFPKSHASISISKIVDQIVDATQSKKASADAP